MGNRAREIDKDEPGFVLDEQSGKISLRIHGCWNVSHLPVIEKIASQLSGSPVTSIVADDLLALDTVGAYYLLSLFRKQDVPLSAERFTSFSPGQLSILSVVAEDIESATHLPRPKPFGLVEEMGCSFLKTAHWTYGLISFIGEAALESAQLLRSPKLFRGNEVAAQLDSAFVRAIPVVALVTFLIGIVIAYLFGIQIEQYGASIFVVDGSGLAMCRELSPVLVAIIVAGRSGSAFTAQIGAMRLNQEIEAMIAMGLKPMRVLVLPRVFALMIALPLLVVIGDVAGIFGSMVIADIRLGVTYSTFVERLQVALPLRSFLVGVVKAPTFAIFIALIGCSMGLAVEKNARSVGTSTTSTVVRSIVSVILLNAAFAVIFVELGI